MSKQHNHLQELLQALSGLDTDGPNYQLHRELVRLGHAIEHDIEAAK